VLRAGELFDSPPTREWTERFLTTAGHHLLAALEDGAVVGFVSSVETTHPDKGTEMFLYELCVRPAHRNRGVGRALVEALLALARECGWHGMWVGVGRAMTPRWRPIAQPRRRATARLCARVAVANLKTRTHEADIQTWLRSRTGA